MDVVSNLFLVRSKIVLQSSFCKLLLETQPTNVSYMLLSCYLILASCFL